MLALAFPLILANITTPILGLIDTAILGRMDEVYYFAGAAIGSLIVTQLYWVCGFLKMSVTGLSAQSKSKSSLLQIEVLTKGVVLSLAIAAVILISQSFVLDAGLYFAKASTEVSQSAQDYFSARIWGAPAALINMAIIGWLVGQQKTSIVLVLQIVINLANILASLLFVYVFDWGVSGVASATVCAEYLMLTCASFYIYRVYAGQSNSKLAGQSKLELTGQSNSNAAGQSNSNAGQSKLQIFLSWLTFNSLKVLLSLNANMFLRNLALQFTLAFITLKGAQYGAQAIAVNAIIMQFFTLIALGLDGIANATEALVGEEKGRNSCKGIHQHVKTGLLWSSVIAVLYMLVFYSLDSQIINLLTHHQGVVEAMKDYGVIVVLIPVVSHWCFLMDGVFVGLSKGKAMRDTMLISVSLSFLPVWWVFRDLENMALWIAMLTFLGGRGCMQGIYYVYWYVRSPGKLLT